MLCQFALVTFLLSRLNPIRHNERLRHIIEVPTASCHLKPAKGPCLATIRRWFFNTTSGDCETFLYGGCLGNRNRFRSKAICQRRCEGANQVSPNANSNSNDPRALDDGDEDNPQLICYSATLGRRSDLQKQPSDYSFITPYLQIFLGLQARCEGRIRNVKFIDGSSANAGKAFYLGLWEITELTENDVSQAIVSLVNVSRIVSNGQSGWQDSLLTPPMPIKRGQYIGIHYDHHAVLHNDCVVPYTEDDPIKTITIRTDHRAVSLLESPANFSTFARGHGKYSFVMRRPALVINIDNKGMSP